MQLVTTTEQMKRFDRAAMSRYGIAGIVLMENAGRGFVDVLMRTFGEMQGKDVTIFCGTGNNGGDGFVIARHLVNAGARVQVFLLGKKSRVKRDALSNLKIVMNLGSAKGSGISVDQLVSMRQLVRIRKPDVIVDALFGTGFSGRIEGLQEKVVKWINQSGAKVAAVDIASGVNATTGVVENVAVKADVTATMGLAKIGHYVGSGRDHSGKVGIVDIGIPQTLFKPSPNQVYRVDGEDVRQVLPKRPASVHKYSVGKIFVLAGSRGFTGAPYMCAQAAMKSGAGAVILGVPKSLHVMMARKVTEVMVIPLEETAEGSVSFSALPVIFEKIRWANVIVVGPGLSDDRETQRLLMELIRSIRKPLVIDADGLKAVSENSEIVRRRKHDTILTPHVGELSRIIGMKGNEIESLRVSVAQANAKKLGCILALKGAPTVTTNPKGLAYLNSTGNPGMATAGAGDVLAGIVAGFVGQGMPAAEATYAGVFIHGLAGDIAAKMLGQKSMLALDILDHIPDALKQVEL